MKLSLNIFFSTLLMVLMFVGCGPSEQEQAQQQEREQQMHMQMVETTPEFNEQISSVLDHYFDLKNALVESDAGHAEGHAESLLQEAEQVDPTGLNQDSHAMWVSFSEVLMSKSRDLSAEEDIEDQRYHFEYISQAMIEMVDTFQPVGYEVYHQSCPMVRDGSADWLSREEEVKNPYHGDRMMNCGEVIRSI